MPPPADNIPLANVLPHPAPDEPGSHPVNRAFDFLLVFAFLAVIAIPLIGTWRHWDPYRANKDIEKRVFAPFPETPHTFRQLTHYSDDFFAFFKDNFGFRNTLIHYFQNARYQAGLITHNDHVLVGKDGWLFLSVRPDQGFRQERGFERFSGYELDLWQNFFEKRTAYFKSKGIAYVCFFAPDKKTIYPEFMPAGLSPTPPTRLDELLARLKSNHSTVPMIDVRPAVLAAKSHPYIYFKTDTHWNGYGAFAAYQSFLSVIQQKLPQFTFIPQTLDDFTYIDAGVRSGDLVGMLGLDTQIGEHYPVLVPKIPLTPIASSEAKNPQPWRTYENTVPSGAHGSADAPSLVIFHDSFGNFLPNLIGPHFRHSYFHFIDTVELEPLETYKPNIVITELVERKLYEPVPLDPPEIDNFPIPPRWPAALAPKTAPNTEPATGVKP